MSKTKLANILKACLPWIVAILLLVYLFKKTPPKQVWSIFREQANLPLFVTFAIIYFLTVMCIDNWGLAKVISKFAIPITFKKLLPARCVSYLVSLVNYNAGQAGMALYLSRNKETSFFKTLGSIFFITLTDLYWILALAFFGSFFLDLTIHGFAISLWVRHIAVIGFVIFVVQLVFWRKWITGWVPKKLHLGFSEWIRNKHLFTTLHNATLQDYAKAALYRLPVHLTIVSSLWFLIHIFGANISMMDVISTVPIILLMGTLPITPGGLGAVQIGTVELLKDKIIIPTYSPVSPEEMLLTISLTWMFANYVLKGLAGLIFLRKNKK